MTPQTREGGETPRIIRTDSHKLLDRLLIISQSKNHETGRLIADRMEHLESALVQAVNERCALLERVELLRASLEAITTSMECELDLGAWDSKPHYKKDREAEIAAALSALLASPPARPATQPDKKD